MENGQAAAMANRQAGATSGLFNPPISEWKQVPAPTPKLYGALAKAQAAFPPIGRNRTVRVRPKDQSKPAYSFEYATLDNILACVRPVLAEHGLCLFWRVRGGGDVLTVETVLAHESGEEITCVLSPGSGPGGYQELGSAITYLRRYGATALLGIASEEDDDGNGADGNHVESRQDRAPSAPATAPRQQPRAAAPKPIRHKDDTGEPCLDGDAADIRDLLLKNLKMPKGAAIAWLEKRFGAEAPGDLTVAQAACARVLIAAKMEGEAVYRAKLAELVADGWVRDDGQAEAA